MTPSELIASIGGVPLVDSHFDVRALLSCVCTLRAEIDGKTSGAATEYIRPGTARDLYSRRGNGAAVFPPTKEFRSEQRSQISEALQQISRTMPEWALSLSIPMEFVAMAGTAASTTHRLIPQTIFLGEGAFDDELRLQETLVHEYSHVLCGMIAEVFDFQLASARAIYVLPSGTAGKEPRGLLLAALFAGSAALFLNRLQLNVRNQQITDRLDFLLNYLKGTSETLQQAEGLSIMGQLLSQRVHQLAREIAK